MLKKRENGKGCIIIGLMLRNKWRRAAGGLPWVGLQRLVRIIYFYVVDFNLEAYYLHTLLMFSLFSFIWFSPFLRDADR